MADSAARRKPIVSTDRILKILAKQGISKDQVTYSNFEHALREYRGAHPGANFERQLQVTLAYGDFAMRNRALLSELWSKAKLLAVNPRQWHEMAEKFGRLVTRQADGLMLGVHREPLQIYGNHLNCCWMSTGDAEIGLRFDVLAAEAGRCLGTAPGIREAIQDTSAQSWADFWKYCLWFHLGHHDSKVTEPIVHSAKLCLHIAFRCRANGRESFKADVLVPPKSEILGAIGETSTTLERLPSEDPLYEMWRSFVLKNQSLELDFVTNIARSAGQGKRPDPKKAVRLTLSLFDNAADAQIAFVRDAESAAACEKELRKVFNGCLVYLELFMRRSGQEGSIKKWRRRLESGLVVRFTKSKKRALKLAADGVATRKMPVPLTRPKRTPDIQISRERLELVVTLARELAIVKQETRAYCTVSALKHKHPKFTLWTLIEESQIQELVDGADFTPKAYAENLTLAKYGLTSRETLKKDRHKLRIAMKAGAP